MRHRDRRCVTHTHTLSVYFFLFRGSVAINVSIARTRKQLHGTNSTYDVLYKVLGEMAQLFPDEVFNIGSDETAAKGSCAVDSTFAVERRVLDAVASDFGKTPVSPLDRLSKPLRRRRRAQRHITYNE